MKSELIRLYKYALYLSVFTILYNIVEGLISTYLGFTDESLTLFGFGVDSFIETISGFGILQMVLRIQANPNGPRSKYERSALLVTGISFYILVIGLIVSGIYNIITKQEPVTTFYGLLIAIISILVMLVLVHQKTKLGKSLQSPAILADAECTKVCIYMSLVLLVSSGMYYFFKLPYVDSAGAMLLAYFSFQEGKECFEEAKAEREKVKTSM